MKRAGDVIGTPDWQLDRMYETETERKLEKIMFSDDDFPITIIESDFTQAQRYLDQAVRKLCEAAKLADPYGKADKIDDLINKLEDGFSYDMYKALQDLKERRESA